MAGIDNLIPNSQRTPEELRAMTAKGAYAVGRLLEKKSMKAQNKIMQIEDDSGLSQPG